MTGSHHIIAGPSGPLWAVRPDDRLHVLSNVQHWLKLPDSHRQQLPHGRDHPEGREETVRQTEHHLSPAALCRLRHRVPPLHPPLLPHHPPHSQDVLQPLSELLRKLAREITSIEPTESNAGQVVVRDSSSRLRTPTENKMIYSS